MTPRMDEVYRAEDLPPKAAPSEAAE